MNSEIVTDQYYIFVKNVGIHDEYASLLTLAKNNGPKFANNGLESM